MEKKDQEGLSIVALYCIGEYTEMCLSDEIEESNIFDLVLNMAKIHNSTDIIKEYSLNCIVKLYNKFTNINKNSYVEIFK